MKVSKFMGSCGICFACKKKFEKGFEVDFDRRFVNNIKLCESCGKVAYEDLASNFVPKGLKNRIGEVVKKDRDSSVAAAPSE